MTFTQAVARNTSVLEFLHIDGSTHGGIVGSTQRTHFSVVSYPRYGDTEPRRFQYTDVSEVLKRTDRNPVSLPLFEKLMGS